MATTPLPTDPKDEDMTPHKLPPVISPQWSHAIVTVVGLAVGAGGSAWWSNNPIVPLTERQAVALESSAASSKAVLDLLIKQEPPATPDDAAVLKALGDLKASLDQINATLTETPAPPPPPVQTPQLKKDEPREVPPTPLPKNPFKFKQE